MGAKFVEDVRQGWRTILIIGVMLSALTGGSMKMAPALLSTPTKTVVASPDDAVLRAQVDDLARASHPRTYEPMARDNEEAIEALSEDVSQLRDLMLWNGGLLEMLCDKAGVNVPANRVLLNR